MVDRQFVALRSRNVVREVRRALVLRQELDGLRDHGAAHRCRMGGVASRVGPDGSRMFCAVGGTGFFRAGEGLKGGGWVGG